MSELPSTLNNLKTELKVKDASPPKYEFQEKFKTNQLDIRRKNSGDRNVNYQSFQKLQQEMPYQHSAMAEGQPLPVE